MAFSASIDTNDDAACDKCGKVSRSNDPVIVLISRSRVDGHHCIYIHVTCFCKVAGATIDKFDDHITAYFREKTNLDKGNKTNEQTKA